MSSQTLVDIAEDEQPTQQFSISEVDSRPTTPGNGSDNQFLPINLNEPKQQMITSTPQGPSQGKLSRQSSLTSVFSDVSNLPGAMDSTYHPYQFQVRHNSS